MVDNKFLAKLSQNLLETLNDEEYYDITIEVGNDPYVKVFRAHMVILYYRSPYLQRILSTNKKKNDGTLVHIKLPNILPEIFQIILRYIYGGSLSLKPYDTSDIIKILVAASELGLQELIAYLQSFLIENNASWMEQNFSLIYQTSIKHDSLLELQKFCTNLIANDPEMIFKSHDFISIPEKSLVSIIQNDNLRMNEIEVWEHVLKWGLAQNQNLSSDPTSYSKSDFNTLKNTLQQCVPFIRFKHLTSSEFSKVVPYSKILPKELYMDLLNYFLRNDKNPSKISKNIREKSIDSKIITFQHAELISKWIDSLNRLGRSTSPYNFKLLFRRSRERCEGFIDIKFHEICDNKSHTVSIVKVKGSNEILGGYNPVGWKSVNGYGITRDSFIFSLENNSVENYILSRVLNKEKAIDNSSSYGPSFGYGDLHLYQDFYYEFRFYCEKNFYEKQIRKTDPPGYVEEFEVFQVKD